ncbi:ABC transporter substrate-binding protein [Pseudonocardia oroxyli]|uniref:Peptide/nickel transport system substrate-binding protein n=1 Tax=Pseudonocardia oroxyli TaxID=366584 RepID=A0A1G7TG49_PSEOR|nr:ABC transporter substrate-binding protein [Pseudonocardia oroxyli]SDG34283.1 peptide/nickel transport system substrate-binding protein [Pseudonocardia oroxyli]
MLGKWSTKLALLLSGALLAAGCAAGTQGSNGGAASSSEPRSGGTLTLLNQAETQGINPTKMGVSLTATRGDGLAGFSIFGGLVLQDAAGNLQMSMAESLQTADNTTWTLKLRPGLVFTDGTPFDAAAVKSNWERHGAQGSTSFALPVVRAMSALNVVDDRTLQIVLAAPNGQWPRSLATYPINFIASPTSLEATPDAPLGAGPFVLKEWLRDDHMTLVKNPKYFDAPRPYLDEIVIRPIPDSQQKYNALVSGQGQIMHDSVDFQLASTAEAAGFQVLRTAVGGAQGFVFNEKRAPFNDVRVRKAVQLGVDLNLLNELVQGGKADLATTMAPVGTTFYDASTQYPPANRAEAQRLIDEAVAANGGPIKFSILTVTRTRSTAEGVQTLLSELKGLEVSVNAQATTQAAVVAGDYDMGITGFFLADPEPVLYDGFNSKSPRNFMGYSNPEVDAALVKGRSSGDEAERKAAYATVQRALVADMPFLPLWRVPSAMMYTSKVQGVKTIADGLVRIDEVWLTED